MRSIYDLLIKTPEGKRQLGSPQYRSVIYKKDLKEIRWEGVDWIPLAQDR
jgi:hypothetical protein